jgi:hypothetical protein
MIYVFLKKSLGSIRPYDGNSSLGRDEGYVNIFIIIYNILYINNVLMKIVALLRKRNMMKMNMGIVSQVIKIHL